VKRLVVVILAIVAAVLVYVSLPIDRTPETPLPSVESVRLPKRMVHFEITAGSGPGAGARVLLESAGGPFEADRQGRASFQVPERRSTYCVQLPGHYCSWGQVGAYESYDDELEERIDEVAKVELEPAPNALGRVVLPDGKPAQWALVQILQEEGGTTLEFAQVTDSKGRFGVSAKPPFVVEAVAEGYGVASRRVGEAKEIVVRLGNGATVRGRVTGAGHPSDVMVYAVSTDIAWMVNRNWFERISFGDADREFCAYARAGPDGAFVMRGVQPGEHILVAFRPREGQARSVPFRATGEVHQDIRFTAQAGLLVKVLSPDGNPITQTRLDLTRTGDEDMGRWPYYDNEGTHLFIDIPLDVYELSLEPPGYMPETVKLDLTRPGLHTHVHRAKSGSTISGRVIDSKGRGIEGVRVSFRVEPDEAVSHPFLGLPMMWKRLGQAVTGKDGSFEIRGLPKVRGHVFVDGAGYAETKHEAVPGETRLGPIVASRLASLRLQVSPAPRLTNVQVGVWMDGIPRAPESQGFDADGTVRLSGLATGCAGVVRVEVPGYAPIAVRFEELAPEEDRDLGVAELTQGRNLKGIVVLRNGEPVAKAKVSLATAMTGIWCETMGDGRFDLRRVGIEPAVLVVEGASFVSISVREVEVDAGGELRIVVEQGGIVTGHTVDQEGKPVDGSCECVLLRGPRADTWIDIEETGEFRKRVLAGTYDVIVVRRGGEKVVRSVTVSEGETTEFDVMLPPSR
jgi:hypothetical protein